MDGMTKLRFFRQPSCMRHLADIQTPERSEFMRPVLPTFPDLSRRTVLVVVGACGQRHEDKS